MKKTAKSPAQLRRTPVRLRAVAATTPRRARSRAAPESITASEVFERGTGSRWRAAIQRVHRKFEYPSTLSPGFQTSPCPSARLRA